jgi:general stress protein CsbA
MFWNIFLDSLTLIIGILVVGWCIAALIRRRERSGNDAD